MVAHRTPDPWIPYLHLQQEAECPLRLFCFPYAGGSASAFRPWLSMFPTDIAVCPIQLPGRENRYRETLYTSLTELTQSLENALLPYLDRDFAFFGHSMGALICFELARDLRKKFGLSPLHLFASACLAPQQRSLKSPICQLPNPAFIERLHHRYNGVPREVLENAELMQLFLPILRADFTLVETYKYTAEAPLDCSITALGGWQDKSVKREDLQAWSEQTHKHFNLRMFSGDHFFLRSSPQLLVQSIVQDLKESLNDKNG